MNRGGVLLIVGLMLLVLLLFSPLSFAGEGQPDPALEARVSTLAYKLRCLVCENQSIAESNAPLAADLREQVREQFQAGKSEQEVIAWLTERYGDYVLYDPPVKPITLLLWGGPVLLLVLGAGGLFVYLRGRQRGDAAFGPPCEAPQVQVEVQVERGWIVALAIGVPLLALVGYLLVGTPMALAPPALTETGQAVARMVARAGELTAHLAEVPDDVAGWEELSILRVELDDPVGAARALARLSALRPDDADVLVAWAVAVAMRDQTLDGEAETLLRRALAINPEHPRAQAMLRHGER